jgi:hypothetical protein
MEWTTVSNHLTGIEKLEVIEWVSEKILRETMMNSDEHF